MGGPSRATPSSESIGVSAGLVALALALRLPFVWIAPNNGTDAMARYMSAVAWLNDPSRLPTVTATGAWLPLHFWLLGAVVWLAHSERSARLFTALLGGLTILPYWGTLRRTFDRRVALASTLAFALFGFHIAYSATTSCEAPTLFFMACGVYAWLRFALGDGWIWCLSAGVTLSAASLIRFDPWITIPVLSLLLLDFSRGWGSLWSNRSAWQRAIIFGLASSFGAVGWMVFSELKWGDPMELPHRTLLINESALPVLRHSLAFRSVVVPVSLLTALSPVVFVLAAGGIVWVLGRGQWAARSLAVLAVTFFVWDDFNAIHNETTQARYTLMYTWLLIPFAFEALRGLARRWPEGWADRRLYGANLVFFVLWNGAIVAAGHYGPAEVADRLGPMSPLLEPHLEIRQLTRWLRRNVSPSDTIVMDEFNWQSGTILQFSGVPPSHAHRISGSAYSNPELLNQEVQAYIRLRHPRFAVCSPYGPIGRLWSLDDKQTANVPELGIALQLEWQGQYWRIYRINYGQSEQTTNLAPARLKRVADLPSS